MKEEVFAQHLNTKFYIPLEQRRVELELVKVIGDKSSMNKIEGVERFSIYFLGPGDLLLPQSIYHMEHEAMGEMDIFIVPIGTQEGRYQYEAVFSYMES
ncbi:MAG TPA: hypothetical protein VJS44_09755 [Pyrinomonadaceae bacterium]|nr:hypothetical protein [Pyrinomonadaceae bacterium]